MSASYSKLKISRSDRVLTVALSDPAFGNGIDQDMHLELERLLPEIAEDDSIGAVVLTGDGAIFSAGGNIASMKESADRPELFYPAMIRAKRLVHSVLDCPTPIICRINGDAMGVGATLALLCDVTIAAESARIADPHVRMGYAAGDGGALIWPLLVGVARAKRYLLSGDALTGREAADIGLITAAVPAEELDEHVAHWARRLSTGAQRAINWTKMTMNIMLRQQAAAILDAGMAYEVLTNATRDHREAVSAFIEKRKPVFTGE